MQHGNKYIVLALLLLNFARDSMPFLLPAVIWDPRNPLFHCPSKANQEINVRIHDSLNLVCPHKSINIGGQKDFVKTEDLYETAYLLQSDQENQFNNCNSSGGRELLKCQTPNAFAYTTLTFKLISGSGDATFVPGKTYYLIGTGNHTVRTIDNKVGGSCRGTDGTYKLKLKIKVCLDQDSSCGICSTTACYTKGCGNYTSWNDTGLYRNLSTIVSDSADGDLNLKPLSQSASENNCVQLRSRSCDNEDDGCIGSSVSLFNTTCPNVKVSPDIKDCSTWQSVGDIYRNSTNGCFLIKSRECWIGTIEKVNTTEWKLEQTICPVGGLSREVTGSNETKPRIDIYHYILIAVVCILLAIIIFLSIVMFYNRKERTKPTQTIRSVTTFKNESFYADEPMYEDPVDITDMKCVSQIDTHENNRDTIPQTHAS